MKAVLAEGHREEEKEVSKSNSSSSMRCLFNCNQYVKFSLVYRNQRVMLLQAISHDVLIRCQ